MLEMLFERANNFQLVSHLIGVRNAAEVYSINLWRRRRAQANGEVQEIHVRGFPSPLFYRPGSSDWRVFLQVIAKREYEIPSVEHDRAVQSRYEDLLSRGSTPVIVDCGANIGLSSVWYALRYPQANIYAVEPEPGNFAILKKNCAHFSNILPVRAAVSDRKETLSLANEGSESWAWKTVEDSGGDIEAVTVPDLLSREQAAALFVAKIDIEGFEVELFRSNREWVDHVALVVFESHDGLFPWRGTAHSILSVLARRKRDYLQNGENTFAILHPEPH